MSEDAAKPLWSLDVPTLEDSIATDLAAAGPVSLLFAGIAAGCAPCNLGCCPSIFHVVAPDIPTLFSISSAVLRRYLEIAVAADGVA